MATKIAPYKKGLPWIGSILDLMNDTIGFLGRVSAEYDEIVRFKAFGSDGYVIVHPDLVREALVTKAKSFRKADAEVKLMGRFLGNGLVTNNHPTFHKRQRKLMQPAFHARRIAGYADTIVDYTQAMLDEWQPNTVRDISENMQELTMYIVAKTLFDADRDGLSGVARGFGEAMDTFQRATDADFGLPITLPSWVPTRKNRELKAALTFTHDTLREIIDKRKRSGEDKGDLLSMLLMAQDEDGNGMEEQQLLDEVLTLFAAGHETTSNALTWTLYLLSQHPDIAAKVRAEVDETLQGRAPTLEDLRSLPYTLMVLKESMRVLPPVYALNGRVANEDVTIGGYDIPKDSFIIISPWVMHFGDRWFPEPEMFDPERFSAEKEPNIPRYAYMPFGGGPRVCIGNSFAMMEAHLILTTVVQRYQLELVADQKIEFQQQITLSNKHGMHMRLVPKQDGDFSAKEAESATEVLRAV